MKLFYNAKLNIAYLSLLEKSERVESLPINRHIVLDLGPDGTLYGIELLNANEQLRPQNGLLMLQILNQASGEVQHVVIQW